MRVLMLVTNAQAEFFRSQVDVLARQGVDVTVLPVSGSRRATDETDEGRSIWQYVRYYPKVLRASFDSYDVVHANYGLTGPPALAQPTRPVVLSLWGSDLAGSFGPVSRTCARLADATIVMSEDMAAAVGTESHVVPHGVDLDTFRPFSRSTARRIVGWRADAKHVLFPYATQRPVKDYPRAERIVDRVRERVAARAAVGSGATGSTDVELHAIHGVPHDRMPLHLNAADALLLTSKWEGSPNSVKEALACNTPVVATDVGDVSERVDGVRNAFVASTDGELADSLATVLERGEPADGRDAVESLSVDRMGERIRDVYRSVLGD